MIKKIAVITFCVLLPMMAHADDAAPAATPALTPELQQKFSYAIGRDIGKSLETIKDVVVLDSLKQALDDSAAGKPGPYSEEDLLAAKADMGKVLHEKLQAEQAAAAAKNQAAADEFLKTNGKRKGVITTASGLQYEVLTAAKGAHPQATSNVTVHYRGTLIDGTEFDSSYARGVPVSFPLNNVILGWTEGVQLMAKGAKYRFYLPPALAYGDRGAGTKIGPDTLLIFEVELVSFEETPPSQ